MRGVTSILASLSWEGRLKHALGKPFPLAQRSSPIRDLKIAQAAKQCRRGANHSSRTPFW